MPQEGTSSSRTRAAGNCEELSVGAGNQTLGPLQKQHMLLTTCPSLQTPRKIIFNLSSSGQLEHFTQSVALCYWRQRSYSKWLQLQRGDTALLLLKLKSSKKDKELGRQDRILVRQEKVLLTFSATRDSRQDSTLRLRRSDTHSLDSWIPEMLTAYPLLVLSGCMYLCEVSLPMLNEMP